MTTSVESAQPARSRGDSGFTLIELLVTIVIAGILFGLVVGGYRAYAATQAHRGAADASVALLREAHQRAITEGQTYAVSFNPVAGPWTMRTGSCTGTVKDSFTPASSKVTASAVSFPTSPSPSTCVVFKPRGIGSDGSLKVIRSGSTKFYLIDVEGLTGRVSIS